MTLRVLSPIHKATRQIGLHLADRMAELGVSNDEAHLLSYLESYGPAPIFELQRVFGHRPSTLTGLIDRLEEGGLVCRRRNPDDGRSFLISLTTAGQGLAASVTEVVARFEARVLSRVDVRDLAGFRAVMQAIGAVSKVEVRGVRQRAPGRPEPDGAGSMRRKAVGL